MGGTDEIFFLKLRRELELRARMLLAGRTSRRGQLLPDDLVQDALAKLIATYGMEELKERSHDTLMSLGYRTMRNLMIDRGRKKSEDLEDAKDDDAPRRILPDSTPLSDERLDRMRRVAWVRSQLDELSEEERCFVTHVIEHDSVPRAQRHCGWPPKSPYYQLRLLFDRLRSRATHDGLDGEGL